MKVIRTAIPDVLIVEPQLFGDRRGYFFESYNRDKYRENGIDCEFVQDNESFSRRGVLRGLHYQAAPFTQAKLVRVIRGSVLDIAVDIRRNSPYFGRYVAIELTGENYRQLFVPRGFAHGFVVLSDEALFSYKCDNFYSPPHERGIAFDDPDLGIDWRVDTSDALLSPKDKLNPRFSDAELFDLNDPEYLS